VFVVKVTITFTPVAIIIEAIGISIINFTTSEITAITVVITIARVRVKTIVIITTITFILARPFIVGILKFFIIPEPTPLNVFAIQILLVTQD
jgi:hypothetical protein